MLNLCVCGLEASPRQTQSLKTLEELRCYPLCHMTVQNLDLSLLFRGVASSLSGWERGGVTVLLTNGCVLKHLHHQIIHGTRFMHSKYMRNRLIPVHRFSRHVTYEVRVHLFEGFSLSIFPHSVIPHNTSIIRVIQIPDDHIQQFKDSVVFSNARFIM